MENKKKKKILIFSLVYYPRHVGGAEIAIKNITDHLGDKFDFDMITLRKIGPKHEKIGNVNVYRVGSKVLNNTKIFGKFYKYLFIFRALVKALSLHRKNSYDAVWSMMASYAGFSAMFFKTLNPKVPFLLSLQEGDPIDYIRSRVGFLYSIFRKIFTKADMIQAISNYLADFGRMMCANCDVRVVPNGVDFKLYSKVFSEMEIMDIKKDLEKADRDIFIITTSRLVAKNAIEDLIKAMHLLPSFFKLLILGEGYLMDDLTEIVSNLSLQHRVKFLGYVDYDVMPKYFSVSNIFVRASLSEGFGNSFIEAMASSLPVIATPVGGIKDFLRDRETGLFCEIKNPKSVAEKILLLNSDTDLRERIIKNARKMVAEKYDWENVSTKMGILFDELIKENKQ